MAHRRLNSKNKLQTLNSGTTTYIDYAETKQILEVEFIGGRTYQYLKVPPSIWLNYKQSVVDGKSSGEFVNLIIKPNYPFREVT